MRWLACFVLLAGCLRARGTAVHPTGLDHATTGDGATSTIARDASGRSMVTPAPDDPSNLYSVELGAMIPLGSGVHVAPGARIFNSQLDTVLWGVAIGADFIRQRGQGFALEGSLHLGSSSDPKIVEQALDLFAGVTMHSNATNALAVGPSVGILAMPGGHSVVMFGLGLRLTGRPY